MKVAPENTATVCAPSGSAPTTSMPSTSISSLICWKAMAASPVSSFSAVKPCGITIALAFTASAMPSRSISPAKKMPLAPARE